MKALYFTPSDINAARWVLATADTLRHGPRVIKWARKVCRWARELKTVIRQYSKTYGQDTATARIAVYDNLKAGTSLRQMRRDWQRIDTTKKYSRASIPRDVAGQPDVSAIRPKVAKHNLRSKRRRQTDAYQCGGLYGSATNTHLTKTATR